MAIRHLHGRTMMITKPGPDGYAWYYHYHYMGRAKTWSSLLVAVLLLGVLGCADAVELIPSGERGGVVTYPVKGTGGAVTSPYRKEALQTIAHYCQGPYDVVREGETRSRAVEARSPIGVDMVVQRRWGIQFRCK